MQKVKETKIGLPGEHGGPPVPTTFRYYVAGQNPDTKKDQMLVVIRISFARDATDPGDIVRLSPGACRLVAKRANASGDLVPSNYYPLGTVEMGSDGPILFVDKPDDYLFVPVGPQREERPGVDLLYAVDKAGFVTTDKDHRVESDVFIEYKRLWRQDLSGHSIDRWMPGMQGIKLGVLHKKTTPQPFPAIPATGPAGKI